MVKTEYRIKPICVHGVMQYFLQFKDIVVSKRLFRKPREKEVWKYIPNEDFGTIRDIFHSKEKCPDWFIIDEDCFINDYYFNEKKLIEFTKKYPYIQDYFDELKLKYEAHTERKEKEKFNVEIKYL